MARRKRYKPSYLSSILSVAFVLFLLGALVILIFQAKKLSNHFKENIEVSLFLKDETGADRAATLEDEIAALPYTKSTNYISKEDAAADFSDEFDAEILDHNPLPASINLYLKASYANKDSLKTILADLEARPEVSEIVYQEALMNLVNSNVSKISLYVLGFSTIFLLIAFTLIDAAIRLSMYSKRFLIKSMQMVGARNSFIVAPFLQRGMLNGILSAALAILMLLGVYYLVTKELPALFSTKDSTFFILVFLGILLLGIIVSLLSTFLSVKKYLRTKVEDLY